MVNISHLYTPTIFEDHRWYPMLLAEVWLLSCFKNCLEVTLRLEEWTGLHRVALWELQDLAGGRAVCCMLTQESLLDSLLLGCFAWWPVSRILLLSVHLSLTHLVHFFVQSCPNVLLITLTGYTYNLGCGQMDWEKGSWTALCNKDIFGFTFLYK